MRIKLRQKDKFQGIFLDFEVGGEIFRSKTIMGDQLVNFSLIIALIGMLITCAGALSPISDFQKALFLTGAIFLITAAIIERHSLFIFLQMVVICGTIAAFLPFSALWKALIPCVAGAIAIVICLPHIRNNKSKILGVIGLITLALGFAISHPMVYLIGALSISLYSFCEFRKGVKIAFLWFIMNILFAVASLVAVFKVR